ncbi:MAG TPA: patatin-like phospholipase family protein [Anaerolineales bacterium]|jgi:NTE family protein
MDITLALGGGGARGNAHIGVLRRLVKEKFRIRAVAGTSFGGIVASMFAAGYSPDEIEEIFIKVDQSRLYDRRPGDGPSLYGLTGVSAWLEEVLGDRVFADLKLPCALTAVDLQSGEEVVLGAGNVREAVLSTIALPGIFPSVHTNGWELVDGGVLNPVPVSVARGLAPNLPVVAVALNLPMKSPGKAWPVPLPRLFPRTLAARLNRSNYARAFETFVRSVDIGGRAVAEYRLAVDKPEVIIRPDVGDIQTLDRVNVAEVALRGEVAVEAALPALRRAVSWPARLSRRVSQVTP